MKDLTNYPTDDSDELFELSTVQSNSIFDSKSENFRRALSKQLLDSVWTDGKDFQEQAEARVAAIEAWETFEPLDATEALLAAQLIGVHNAVMGYFHLAAIDTLEPDVRERAVNKAAQLLRLSESLAAALDKHRGKGQQKITVERVTLVEAGGQAIVGNVERPAIAPPMTTIPPPAPTIEHSAILAAGIRVRSRTRANAEDGASTARERSSRRG